MALSKQRKAEIIDETADLLTAAKLTVFAKYPGTSVQSLQRLRRDSRESGTTVRVIKNRLFKRAAAKNQVFKDLNLDSINGQLLYAFNADDEAAPAQELAKFAASEPQVEFIGALTSEGQLLNSSDVKALAALPSKQELRAKLVGTLAAPLSGFVNVTAGNLRGVLSALSARAESTE